MEQDQAENSAEQRLSPARSPQEDLHELERHREDHFDDDLEPQDHEYDPTDAHYEAPDIQEITPTVLDAIKNRPGDSSLMQSDSLIPTPKYGSMSEFTEEFWKERKKKMLDVSEAEMMGKSKNMSVPMARVKKIMRIDDDVRSLMIASDAPLFMAQACEFFIEEMTGMGWQYVSESRRRILQKSDIAAAVQKNDQFDFLIDFLPPKGREPPTTVKQALTQPDFPMHQSPSQPSTSASFYQKSTPLPPPAPPHPQLKPLPERTPRPWGMPRLKTHGSWNSSQHDSGKEAPTDPASITLGSQPGSSQEFQVVVNETPNGNEFQYYS